MSMKNQCVTPMWTATSRAQWGRKGLRFLVAAFQCWPLGTRYGFRDTESAKSFLEDAWLCFGKCFLPMLLLISILASAFPLMAQERFAVRLGAQVGPGTKTGVVEFLIGQSKSTITASRDGTGRIVQTFASGMERKLFTVGRVSFAASGQAGIVSNPDNVSGLAQGATTVIVKGWRNLSFVIEGVGTNAPAQGGEWDGSARITAQWEF